MTAPAGSQQRTRRPGWREEVQHATEVRTESPPFTKPRPTPNSVAAPTQYKSGFRSAAGATCYDASVARRAHGHNVPLQRCPAHQSSLPCGRGALRACRPLGASKPPAAASDWAQEPVEAATGRLSAGRKVGRKKLSSRGGLSPRAAERAALNGASWPPLLQCPFLFRTTCAAAGVY